MEAYKAVRNCPHAIARRLDQLQPNKEVFLRVRGSEPSAYYVDRACNFIYLNKCAWNGLYRVNSSGRFNVPYGRPKTDFLFDRENLVDCSLALRKSSVTLSTKDFEQSLLGAGAQDLVFLDPPYVTRHNNNGFVDYNETLFSWQDQIRLARVAEGLRRKGATVIVTNAHHDDIVQLYPEFNAYPFSRISTLAADLKKRGTVSEAVLVGHPG